MENKESLTSIMVVLQVSPRLFNSTLRACHVNQRRRNVGDDSVKLETPEVKVSVEKVNAPTALGVPWPSPLQVLEYYPSPDTVPCFQGGMAVDDKEGSTLALSER
jgi:hypothetical protein